MILSLLLSWLLFGCLFLTGRFFFPGQKLFIQVLLGTAVWSLFSWFLTLFGPYAWISAIAVVAIAVYEGFKLFKTRNNAFSTLRKNRVTVSIWIFSSALMSFYAADLPLNFDTGAYHLQVVQWLTKHGAVPGIAHLDVHFGAISAWFSAISGLEIGFLTGKTYHFVNAIPWLAGLAGALTAFASHDSRPSTWMIRLSLPLVLFFSRGTAASLSPDLPAVIFAFGSLFLALSFLESPSSKTWLACAMLSISAIACKLSMAPLFLLPVAIAFSNGMLVFSMLKKELLVATSLGTVVLSLFLLHNHFASGWILFPTTLSAGFEPDWQLAPEKVVAFAQHVKLWGIRPDYQNLASLTPLSWLPKWWLRNVSTHFFPAESVALILFVPVTIVAFFVISSPTRRRYFPILLVSWVGLGFWFLSSPNPRFATYWVISAVFIPLSCIVSDSFTNQKQQFLRNFLIVVSSTLLLLYIPESGIRGRAFGNQNYLLTLMRPAPEGPVVAFETIDGTTISVPESGYRVFNAPIPAGRRGEFCIIRRGPSLADGFRAAPKTCQNP